MTAIPKEVIKELIRDQKFNNTTEVMEAELENELGYEKQERRSDIVKKDVSKNYRNGYSKKIKT